MNSFFDQALGFLYPTRCGVCGTLGDHPLCPYCRESFQEVRRHSIEGIDRHALLFHYTGRAGQAVRRLKYGRATCLASPISKLLAQKYREEFAGYVDAIVPVPMHWSRRCDRGFNQSELLGVGIEDSLLWPALLKRIRATSPQASMLPEQRMVNLRGAFETSSEVAGKRILLIDDVVTSGATMAECASALRRGGASWVGALAFAGSP